MRLIRGAAGAGKTRTVLAEFREALAADRYGARLVVPTATLVRHLRNELARDGLVFPPNAVVSLSRFAAERAPGAKLVSAGLLRAIVQDALRQLRLPEFAAVAETRGMVETVLDTIHRLENAGAIPDGIRGSFAPELKALIRLWRKVVEMVETRGFVTRAGLLRLAALNPDPLKIWMDGFLAFSPVESELVRSLATNCELTLTLPEMEGTKPVRQLALQLGAADRLLTGAVRAPARVLAGANSLEREADEIARRIVELRASGMQFRDIAVAVRDPGAYVSLLRATFERFEVPARFYFDQPLESHPATIFLSGLVEGALNGWEFEKALETLRANPAWGRSYEFDRFDFRVREQMPGRGRQRLLEFCESAWLRSHIEGCLKTESWVGMPAAPLDWVSRFERMAEDLYQPRDPASVQSARSHPAAVAAWLTAMEEAAAFWVPASGPVTMEQFWSVARTTLTGARFSIPDDRRDVVHVVQAYEARQWDVRVLIVCGATDRAYPLRRTANPLLDEDAIRSLRNKGVPLRNADDDDADEIALMQALESRASEHLIFTYPVRDGSGRAPQPTRLVANALPERAQAVRPAGLREPADGLQTGRIETPGLIAALAERHREVRITSLENLMQCRFHFFAERTLELKSRPQRPNERLEARIGGLVLHEALEHWQADLSQDFRSLFKQAFETAIHKHGLPQGYRLEVERLQLGRIATKVGVKQRWNPMSTQVEVPLSISFPGGITANGRVDRIDELDDGRCIIVDYKAGKVNNVLKLIDSQTSLQGPLYARAVRDALGLKTIAMIFWAIREDRTVGWGSVESVDGLVPMPDHWADEAHGRASERLADFLLGHIHARPTDEARCRWCDFVDTCRVEVHPSELVQIAGKSGG
jgi:ATP-dependent helicase/DNAse subunit B